MPTTHDNLERCTVTLTNDDIRSLPPVTEPIEWHKSFVYEDVSRWYEPELVVEQCCEAEGWLPLPSGEFTECPIHAEVRLN